ncbi:MAG: NYN domain-containing protein [Coriobacteriia bacterium]
MIIYVIDGYNVLLSDPHYRGAAEQDMDTARARLVSDVGAYVHGEADAVVVFDGASNPDSDGRHHDVAGVDVVFSPFGQDADSLIEQMITERISAGDEVRVVTSDAETQRVALGKGALRISSAGFIDRAREDALDTDHHASLGTPKMALDERIDPTVRDALSRWARGR